MLVDVPEDTAETDLKIDLLTREGWGNTVLQHAPVEGEGARIKPLGEGINRVHLGDGEYRFLALEPPERLDEDRLRETLPHTAGKLLSDQPVTLLAIGDSVTETGDYPEMLAMLFERATSNTDIHVHKRAYPGKSIDASVRNFEGDLHGIQPDLVLIMYGLNDQGSNSPLIAYLEQYAWLTRQLKERYDADVVFLEPTPHIHTLTPGKGESLPPASSIFRTITFASALRDLGQQLDVPVVPAFDALWGTQADGLREHAQALWPLYPVHYKQPMTTLLETQGKGDTIHPNALGHLQISKAVYRTLCGQPEAPTFGYSAKTVWEEGKPRSILTLRNNSDKRQRGTLRIYPYPENDTHESHPYDLESGGEQQIAFAWPGVEKPGDLLVEPMRTAFRRPGPYLQIWNRSEKASEVAAVAAPWEPRVYYESGRYVAQGPEVSIGVVMAGESKSIAVSLPVPEQTGRVQLVEPFEVDGKTTYAVGELVFTQYAEARAREVTVDADLEEWQDARWVPVGETEQARWLRGPMDRRQAKEEAYTEWAIAAGEVGIYIAFRGQGNPKRDTVTLFFDPRAPEALGTVGAYYWLDVRLDRDGSLSLRPGDTSPSRSGLIGKWIQDGAQIEGELFIPYPVIGLKHWPESGDLGWSIIWKYQPDSGDPTYLMWSENGHPWTPRWYGVARKNPQGALPFRIQVE